MTEIDALVMQKIFAKYCQKYHDLVVKLGDAAIAIEYDLSDNGNARAWRAYDLRFGGRLLDMIVMSGAGHLADELKGMLGPHGFAHNDSFEMLGIFQ